MKSQRKIERSPIEKIEFDGENYLFAATNDCLKYYNIGDEYLLNELMFETQWKKLQDFQYLEKRSICAVSISGSKLSYYFMKYKDMVGEKINTIKEENEESNLIDDSISNLQINISNYQKQRKNIQSGKSKQSNNEKNFEEYQKSNPVLEDLNINNDDNPVISKNNNNNNNASKINNATTDENSVSSDFIDLSSLAKGGKIYL